MGKEKSTSGTILKVSSDHFSKEELEELWEQHNQTLQELEAPTETYTRYTSDLIKSMRDISEKLILAGAIPETTSKRDTCSYVWKKFQERNIPYSRRAFYKCFDDTQKRDWQLGEDKEILKQKHKHTFSNESHVEGFGLVARCDTPCDPKCFAFLLDGNLFEQQELQEKEPELKPEKPKSNYEEENEDFITSIELAITRLKSVVSVWKTTDSKLTIKEKQQLKGDLHAMNKAGEFLDMCYDRKNIIAPYSQHLLSLAFAEGTQKTAGGVFIMYRIDLGKRIHGSAVKTFEKVGKFAKLLSGKQTTKVMRGKVRELNLRYEPQNEKQSMDAGFSGQQCTSCNYWRVGYDSVPNIQWKEGDPIHEKNDTKLVCFHCTAIQKRKHFTLPKQIPLVTIDSSNVV